MSRETIRAFVCFEIPQELREALGVVISAAKGAGERVSWVRPENIHLTVKFLGEMPRTELAEVSALLREIAGATPRFSISIDRLGAFPNQRRPRVLWAGCSTTPPVARNLAARIDKGMVAFGVAAENRPFRPHLTLGRVKQGGEKTMQALLQQPFCSYELPCETLVLMRSDLRPGGPVYTPIDKIMLHST